MDTSQLLLFERAAGAMFIGFGVRLAFFDNPAR
jgi:threonine/homoserine/homoserine lactone efflux protein